MSKSTGVELTTFITSLNGGATIDADLLDVLVDNAKTIIEEERPWEVLRKTDTSVSVTTGNTWETAHDLSAITDFSRFYGEFIKLFDGNNRIDYIRLVPFDRRLENKDNGGTACFDENSKTLYLNGTVAFSGTLWIPYISTSTTVDLTSTDAVWTVFPSRFLPILGYYACQIHKGAIDYDSINKMMLPEHKETFRVLKNALEEWDNEKQLNALNFNDPSNRSGYRTDVINRDED